MTRVMFNLADTSLLRWLQMQVSVKEEMAWLTYIGTRLILKSLAACGSFLDSNCVCSETAGLSVCRDRLDALRCVIARKYSSEQFLCCTAACTAYQPDLIAQHYDVDYAPRASCWADEAV